MTEPTSPMGLTRQEAAERLRCDGPNELPRTERRTPLRIAGEVLREPMMSLLLGGGALYLVLGDLAEAVMLMVLACLSITITVVQEARTERVLDALRDLASPRALVIRDGGRLRIAGREVVRGDLLVLGEGDRVPADARLVEAADLEADESLLTGESVPVRKAAAGVGKPAMEVRPGGDGLPVVYSGSLVVRGQGIAEVTATGADSEIGRIGRALQAVATEQPRLKVQTRKVVRSFAILGAGASILAVLLHGLMRGDWLAALLGGIALGMSMLPEEFPVVLTVFMAVGAWRISRANVLTRRAAAIETLGSATVLCTDKTGTLTENRMTVAALRLAGGGAADPASLAGPSGPGAFAPLVRLGMLACAAEPFDPMERAFHHLARDLGIDASGLTLVRSYGLRPDLLAMTQVWEGPDGRIVAAKGAPEAIAGLCRLPDRDRAALAAAVDAMAGDGMRVLAVASGSPPDGPLPDDQRDLAFDLAGLVGLADPLRAAVPRAVAECQAAGIRVVMITGDYPATAAAVARKAGIPADPVLTGDDVAAMDDDALAALAGSACVYARIMPEQKLRIVTALKARGEIAAMTGDGVNDAPSLKAAHIGIAMGGRGTDVAREASSIVLLDDDFGSIVAAIRLGRRIYDNLKKAMAFILAVHIPIAGLALIPLLFGLPIILGPVHIAFLEMVIDPVCTLVFEAEKDERHLMDRPPRRPDAPLFSRRLLALGMAQGLVAFALVAGILFFAIGRGMAEAEVRALVFLTLIMTVVALILANRSMSTSIVRAVTRPNRALAAVLAAVGAILAVVLLWPPTRDLFRFGPVHGDDLALVAAAGVAVLVALEGVKAVFRPKAGRRGLV